MGILHGEDSLILAHRLLLPDLVEHLGGRLASKITVENFAHMALLADTHACQALKKVGSHLAGLGFYGIIASGTGLHPLLPRQSQCNYCIGPVGQAQGD